MAAGLSDKQIYRRVYNRLHHIWNDLYKRFGEACKMRYADRALTGEIQGVAVEVFFSILRASNGEVAGLPCVKMARVDLFNGPTNERLPWGKDPVDYISERIPR